MSKLSVIIAYVNEYPQIVFTVRAIAEELIDLVDFEIIVVNNYCAEVEAQGRKEDKGCSALEAAATVNPWLRCLKYDTKLSHWQAKNLGVRQSTGDVLWFPDAHVMPSKNSLLKMYQEYRASRESGLTNFTYHLPIGYQILESKKLIYGLVADPKIGKYFYQFIPCPNLPSPFEVPVMSTCGCMMHREIFDKFGGWPEEIGIYGGGEPFFNFSLAVMGMKKIIWPHGCLYHHGEERGYHWNYDGWVRDELIAAYCYGGYSLMKTKAQYMDGNPSVLQRIMDDILSKPSVSEHRELIDKNQVIEIGEWVQAWLS